ncbi:MAG: molecular chaperone HtpG [Clostridia bacterium]|nr:molecular chaperone HtpG [Clostridia bacterium]
MKKFKTESQKILDLMINSIYTHKEIFIRELLSNASDAIDKLYYKSLKENLSYSKEDFSIKLEIDKDKRILRITDNGIGMSAEELESNLGVIARSGSLDFKQNMEGSEDVNIIGQFGVGFYSAFMVSDKVEVVSRAYGSAEANMWSSKGAEGYEITKADKAESGTAITMYIKNDTEEEHYDEFLEEYKIRELVKKYSDYIRYPIMLDVERARTDEKDSSKNEKYVETETLNSMVPLWKKNKSALTEDDYNAFYKDTFYDYEKPLKVIHFSAEGMSVNFNAVLFIPAKAPYNYYSKTYEKGLKLYTNGILIMDKCADLLPDYFSFVKGVVDSELTLNISRETIQHNHQLKKIAANLEKKIKSELAAMLENDREAYQNFFKEFGLQIKYGIYDNWGMNKDTLKDLLLFHSVRKDKPVTIKEYFDEMKDSQKYIYYASGKSVDAIKVLPQVERVLEYDYDILCLTQDIDEFAIKILAEYEKKEFRSVSAGELGLADENITIETEDDKQILALIKDTLGDKVAKVKLSSRLKTHPVCLSSEGDLSIEMEKVFNAMPNAQGISAQKVLELNSNHPLYEKIRKLFVENKDEIKDLAKILFVQAQLIEGLPVDNLTEYSDLVCRKLS